MNSQEICPKCNKHMSKTRYISHVNNILNPCDLRCVGCGKYHNNRQSFYRHKKKCDLYQQKLDEINNKTLSTSESVINNTNNIDGSTTTNNVDCSSKTFNNNQNIIMLEPFDIDHYYMKKNVVIGPKRNHIVELLKDERYADAYEVLFKQIHSNHKLPQHQNIYLPSIESPNLAVFRGIDFILEKSEISLPRLFGRLKFEMKWLVKTCDHLSETEKDQLLWDIQANWMCVDETGDVDIRRALSNNRNVVMKTLQNNIVKSDVDMINNWTAMKNSEYQGEFGIPSPQLIDKWLDDNYVSLEKDHIVQLP